ncbi:uncharacterized protein LOC124266064 isoform X1 [Haliotis rubra]|uniref:uncharacterized protein LOC124266064 isoform X1 n=1 Tax=Haliotis rubra TaxID=36100 RepID=UPI001EE566A6|nr:uncharacterized protein LOC124266064 isoform X1 [Haliotis rubra]XP_046556836.1 uncharacterized protein LOC124266064 isoform X1 [Haliotis rubra]
MGKRAWTKGSRKNIAFRLSLLGSQSVENIPVARTSVSMPSVGGKFTQPVSLEGERRKAMMLVHSVEKDIVLFRDRYFRKPQNKFNDDTNDFIAFVLEKTGSTRRPPKGFREFSMLVDKTRSSAALLYREEMAVMDAVVQRQMMFEELMMSGLDRLDDALKKHVGKFCHSFVSEAEGMDLKCVQDYENNITRWKDDINDGKGLLKDIRQSLKDHSTPFNNFVRHYNKILHYIGLALEVFPRIYNPLKDWVTADEAYVHKVQDELNVLMKQKMDITETGRRQQLRADNLHHKVQHQSYQSKKLRGRLYDAMDERKLCRRREMALMDTYAKNASQLEQKHQYLEETLSRLYSQEPNSRPMYDRHLSSIASLQEDIDKLEKRQDTLQKTLANIKKDRYHVQKEVHKLQVMYDKSIRSEDVVHTNADCQVAGVKVIQDENRVLAEKVEILRRIKSLKSHPHTIRHIHNEGYIPGRRIDISDRLLTAFRIVAPDVGRDWAYLYQRLSFSPIRDAVTRSHDIELLDLSSQRNDLSLRDTVLKSLERWRRLSHDATVPNLVRALKDIRKRDLAKKLEREMLVTS